MVMSSSHNESVTGGAALDSSEEEATVVTTTSSSISTDLDNQDTLVVTATNKERSKDGDQTDTDQDSSSDDIIIVTGADASNHLLPLRDDFEPALTFRGFLIATCLLSFSAVMSQIYTFKPSGSAIAGTFIVLLSHFIGKVWEKILPRGDRLKSLWVGKGGQGTVPRWITFISFINPGPWNLKEHALCSITATSASNAAEAIAVFTAQDLFYDLPLRATTVVLSTISIGLFGYGLCGILRPVAVWHVEAVYWTSLPTIKTLQGLHWTDVKDSKPMRWFWYGFAGMFVYEFFPAYLFPYLNSVSIPCLASMKATGPKAAVLTNLFGGSVNNEGLGLFSLSFDWQYITSINTSFPLTLQIHSTVGLVICSIAMLGIYYSNAWGAKSQPFMSTVLRSEDGSRYPVSKVFRGGVLDTEALARFGIPHLAGTYAYSIFMANAAIGALIGHFGLFWRKDIAQAFKSAREGRFDDRHHEHMIKHYKEAPWWWYISVLVFSFVLGLVVVAKEDISLPPWAYLVSLLLGCIIAPVSTVLFSRFGNGIATNNLSKMLAGLMLPGRPVGNMYFAAWSHNVIGGAVSLCSDLKMGEYLKIPPRIMFISQIYGTVLGAFIDYVMMVSIVRRNRDLLVNGDGNSFWSGAGIQSYNTDAASWALAKHLFKPGSKYQLVPLGLGIGFGAVVVHRLVFHFVPKIRGFSIDQINLPQLLQYAGIIPGGASQTCTILSGTIAGFFSQCYLRKYRPRFFRDYFHLVTGGWDGASLTALFVLSFAVFGVGGPMVPFPKWWGNRADGFYDYCPMPS